MKLALINVFIMRPLAADLINELKKVKIDDIMINLGRAPILEQKESQGFLSNLFSKNKIIDESVSIIQFFIDCEQEQAVLNYIIDKCQFDTPGRGSVYSEFVEVQKCNSHCAVNKAENIGSSERNMINEYTGICCIAQRGEADKIAKVALDIGAGSPHITFGEGTGVRDKMGLLRITIPAEKEIINVATSHYDAEVVMNTMIKEGKLNQPGKGFIYTYPLGHGLLNMKVTRGIQRAAASIEQIVAVLDEMQNSIEWRKRTDLDGGSNELNYLRNLIDLTLICNEGGSEDLVQVAMNAGAAGATISKVKHMAADGSTGAEISKSRERCSMIIAADKCDNIVSELEKAGAFEEEHQGLILTRQTQKAFTYIGKKKAKAST